MGKLVLVTGAARGFGRAVAEVFAGNGWDVVAAVRSLEGLAPFNGRVQVIEHDVRSEPAGIFRAALRGRAVDVLVNNAARGAPRGGVRDADAGMLMASLDVNVAGPLRMVQEVLPALELAPAPLVINVSSRLGSLSRQAAGNYAAMGTSYAYRVSKGAQNMLTISLATSLAKQSGAGRFTLANCSRRWALQGRLSFRPPPQHSYWNLWRAAIRGHCASVHWAKPILTGDRQHDSGELRRRLALPCRGVLSLPKPG